MMILRVGRGHVLRGREEAVEQRKLGINLEQTETGRDAIEYLRVYDYDLILVDLHLPDMSCPELMRTIRHAGNKTPIVVLSETATTEEKVKVLDLGADDLIPLSCDREELMARVRAVARRGHGHSASALRAGPVELRLDRREVVANGQKLSLTRREFSALELLFLKQGAILTKAAFLNHLYCGLEEPEVKSVDVTICRVRKKLAGAGVTDLIDTVWGCGYILRAPDETPTIDGPVEGSKTVDFVAWRDERGRARKLQAAAS
jgi:two-component system, cell cycle response regulator CtrA